MPRFSDKHTARLTDADWRTLTVGVPASQVLVLTALTEGCDNLAIVRTTDAAKGQCVIWYHEAADANVRALLAHLAQSFPVVILAEEHGMTRPPEVTPRARK